MFPKMGNANFRQFVQINFTRRLCKTVLDLTRQTSQIAIGEK